MFASEIFTAISQIHEVPPKVIHINEITPKLQFPSTYHVTGVLKLPYGDINEPFEAWYSKDDKMSRIDYYGGNII